MSLKTQKKLNIVKLLLSTNNGNVIELALDALIEKEKLSYVNEMLERAMKNDEKNKKGEDKIIENKKTKSTKEC